MSYLAPLGHALDDGTKEDVDNSGDVLALSAELLGSDQDM
jgi:hypothetical protein